MSTCVRVALTLTSFLLTFFLGGLSQNCLELDGASLLTTASVYSWECIQMEDAFHLPQSGNVQVVSGRKVHLKAGTKMKPQPGQKVYLGVRVDTVQWYFPSTGPGNVPLYAKVEIGINPGKSILDPIANFLQGIPNQAQCNPFDPEEIDIRADFQFWGNGGWAAEDFRYGFYFQEFRPLTSNQENCCWDSVPTVHPFRVRFTPKKVGRHRFRVSIKAKGLPEIITPYQEFNVTPYGYPGYVKVGPNNRMFELGGTTFFPVGKNLPWPEDYVNGYLGYSRNPVNSNAYENYRERLSNLRNSGANYVRMLLAPWNFEIEFERIGDYSTRMANARELDWTVDHCRRLGLRIHFNLQVHYPFEFPNRFYYYYWDWNKASADIGSDPLCNLANYCSGRNDINDPGYCYSNDLGLATPKDFLHNYNDAWKIYKNRLRYIVSRWGYSPQIAIIELMSEANNIGVEHDYQYQGLNANNCPSCKPFEESAPYREDSAYPNMVFNFHEDMAKFIKVDLGHDDQLLAVNYTGAPNTNPNKQSFRCNIFKGDRSYFSQYIDVWTYNAYSEKADRYELIRQSFDLHNKPSQSIPANKYINKPWMLSEIGTGQDTKVCDDGIVHLKSLVLASFGGVAGSPLNWDHNDQYDSSWEDQRGLANFMDGLELKDWNINPEYFRKENNLLEALYLRDLSSNKIIGSISNRAVNYRSLTDTDSSNSPCMVYGEAAYTDLLQLKTPVAVTSSITLLGVTFKSPVSIPNMGRWKRYYVRWYDISGNPVGARETVRSKRNKILNLDHPTLGPSRENAFRFFRIIRRNENGSQNFTN